VKEKDDAKPLRLGDRRTSVAFGWEGPSRD